MSPDIPKFHRPMRIAIATIALGSLAGCGPISCGEAIERKVDSAYGSVIPTTTGLAKRGLGTTTDAVRDQNLLTVDIKADGVVLDAIGAVTRPIIKPIRRVSCLIWNNQPDRSCW